MGSYTNGIYQPSIGETGWGTLVDSDLRRFSEIYVNVKSDPFGAVGDGVADDWQAITDAIAYVNTNGGTLYFPTGRYKVTQQIDLTTSYYQHWVGGHSRSGLIQFTYPPEVVISGVTMAPGIPMVQLGDQNPTNPLTAGNMTFENIIFFGRDCGFRSDQTAQVRFRNCGFKSYSPTGTDVCGMLLSRVFWFSFEGCTFHNTDGVADPLQPSVILRAEQGDNSKNCGLMWFRDCRMAGGGVRFDVNVVPPENAGNVQFYDTFLEGGTQPFFRFTESGPASAYLIVYMKFINCAVGDTASLDNPIVQLDTPHGTLKGAIFEHNDNPGSLAVKLLNGTVTAAEVQGGATILDGSGNPAGKYTYHPANGGIVIAGNTTNDASTVYYGGGVAFGLGKETEANLDFGIGVDGTHYWGPGGAGGTWDTTLYRSAADTLKTDDALTVGAALTTQKALVQKYFDLADAATVAVNAALATHFIFKTAGNRTIGAPTNPAAGQVITFIVFANATITTTWNAAYHLAGAWVDPANTKARTITFAYLTNPGVGSAWYELSRAAADIS